MIWPRRRKRHSSSAGGGDSSGGANGRNTFNKISFRRGRTRETKPPDVYLSLWETWTTKSDDDDPDVVDWSMVTRQVNADPVQATTYCDEDRRNMLLLHFVCALHPPLSVLELVLEANPTAIRKQSAIAGITPLMIACGRNASPDIIRRLLKADKNGNETIRMTDSSGYSAIHWACRSDVSSEVVKVLLTVDPQLANLRIDGGGQSFISGVTPTNILWDGTKFGKTTTAATTTTTSSNLSHSDPQISKLRMISVARYYGRIHQRNGGMNSAFHASLALKCHEDIVKCFWNRDGTFLSGVRDCFGNLPLHYAVKIPPPLPSSSSPALSTNDEAFNKNGHNKSIVLSELIKSFPRGVSCKDANGCLPLHAALIHGHTWSSGGVKELLEQYPQAVNMRDNKYNLHPFQLAAAFTADTETIYSLLITHPQLLQSASVMPDH